MDYSGKLHEFILQVTAMKLEWNELNQQLEKLNNPESSVDEKYKALTWIAENANLYYLDYLKKIVLVMMIVVELLLCNF